MPPDSQSISKKAANRRRRKKDATAALCWYGRGPEVVTSPPTHSLPTWPLLP